MDKTEQHRPHISIRLIIGLSFLVVLAGCKPPAPQPAQPTLSPIPTQTSMPITPTQTALPPSPTSTPLSTKGESWEITPQNATKVTRLSTMGQGMVNGAPFYSSDGQLLVIPTTIGIDLYEAATLKKLSTIPALSDDGITLMPAYPRLVALSPDSRLLAASLYSIIFSPDGEFQEESMRQAIYLWTVDDGSLAQKIPLNADTPPVDLTFSPDGLTLAAGFDDSTVHLWRVADNEELYSVKGSRLEFSPDGSMLATMPTEYGDDRHVYVYSTAGGDLLRQWEGQRAVFSPDGLLAIENDGAVRLMDVENGIALQAFNGSSAAFSRDGQNLALLDRDQIKLHRVADGSLLQTMEGNFETVHILQFSPDGQALASVGMAPMCPNCLTEPLAVLWQISNGIQLQIDIQNPIWLNFAPNGKYLVVSEFDGVYFMDTINAALVTTLEEYATGVNGLDFSPDGRTLAVNSGQPNITVRLWGVADGRLAEQFEDPSNPGYGDSKVVYSPDGQILWVQGSFWDAVDGERLTELEQKLAEEAPPYVSASVSFSPDGKTMAIGYLEGHLQLWDLQEEKLIRRLEGYQGEVADLAFSPDGKTLAAVYAYPDYIIQLWQVPEGERLVTIQGAEWTHEFTQAVFSPDGQILVSVAKNEDGMDQGTVELWRASDGQQLLKLEAMGILSVNISFDGKIIATGSYDHTVRLWQTVDGALLNTLLGHADYVTDLAFSPSGELLASSSNDGSVILWGLQHTP